MDTLFPDLPTQHPPTIIGADNHVLVQCKRCDGTRIEKCPYPRSHPRWVDWDDTCRGCNGHGWKLERW